VRLRKTGTGHCYLELVEKKGEEIIARARANIWSYTYRILKPYFETTTGQFFTCDIKVLIKASVEFHPTYGLSLNIKDIDPAYTMGDMLLNRREIIERLQQEGVFGMNKELELPVVPQRIAVISSKTAAGYQDFINQLEMNPHGFKFYTQIFEAYMQGAGAVPSIISALEQIFQYDDFFDAVAIIRGGGATADLSSFDNYNLAFHITQFPLPVITGIGHEKDDTIIDLVAHTRLKTPTAVAEFFINGAERFYDQLITLEEEVVRQCRKTLEYKKQQLDNHAEDIHRYVAGFVAVKNKDLVKKGNLFQQRVSSFSYSRKYELMNLVYTLQSVFSVWKVRKNNSLNRSQETFKIAVHDNLMKQKAGVLQIGEQLKHVANQFISREKERLVRNENTVRLLNPENVMRRGYTLTLKDGKILKSAALVQPGDEIETRFADGNVKSKILNKEHHVIKENNV
jgi:exodeoxyribonuclease VII large subunit